MLLHHFQLLPYLLLIHLLVLLMLLLLLQIHIHPHPFADGAAAAADIPSRTLLLSTGTAFPYVIEYLLKFNESRRMFAGVLSS
jgi:hypothetical protein